MLQAEKPREAGRWGSLSDSPTTLFMILQLLLARKASPELKPGGYDIIKRAKTIVCIMH